MRNSQGNFPIQFQTSDFKSSSESYFLSQISVLLQADKSKDGNGKLY